VIRLVLGVLMEHRLAEQESEVLSAAVRKGDQHEVQRLVAAHRDYLKRVIMLRMDRRLMARIDPSDIVQEAQLKAIQRVEEYVQSPMVPVRIWLRRLLCDALVDAQRRHIHADLRSVKREVELPEHSSMSVAQQLLAGIASPSVQFSRKELVSLVRESVGRLPELEREVVLLMVFEGLSSSEAGQVLETDPSTIRKRYGRALIKLEQAFANHK